MVSLAVSLTIIFASAYYDYRYLLNNYIYSHDSRVVIRGMCFALLGFYSISGAIGGVLLFAALFDGILNTLRGKDILYLGNTAAWDRFFNERIFLYLCLKVLCLFAGIYLCLI